MLELSRALWDRLSLYLPILLMGLFALGTLWLVRSAPEAIEAAAKKPLRHEADYFLRNFSIKTFDDSGRLKNELFGAELRHYPDTDTLEIERVRTRSFNRQGELTVATANRAVSDAQGSEVRLLGDVHVVRQPIAAKSGVRPLPIEYRSEFLHVFSQSEKLVTDKPVVISQGADRFSGNAMSYDHGSAVVELRGQVRGVFNPKKAP